MSRVLYYGSLTNIHSGAGQWMFRLANNMREHGWETIAVLPDDDGIADCYHNAGIDVRHLYSKPLRLRRSPFEHILHLLHSFIEIIRLAILIRRENVSIVHINEISYVQALVSAKLGGARVVCHVRAGINSRLLRFTLGWITVLLADQVICVSERTRSWMFYNVGINRESIQVSHDGVPSPERFEDDIDSTGFREQFNINENATLVVSISKLTRIKGQSKVLDAVEQIESEHSEENIVFAVVGGEIDGHETYAQELKNRSTDLEKVTLTGFYPNIVEVLAAADIFVHMPGYEDPFPGVVLEAMLAGVPVIGKRIGGIPEQIDDGKTGYLVDDTHELVQKIQKIHQSQETRDKMGDTAAQYVRNQYPPDDHFTDVNDMYCNLVSN